MIEQEVGLDINGDFPETLMFGSEEVALHRYKYLFLTRSILASAAYLRTALLRQHCNALLLTFLLFTL